jgi:hypothetical protein
MQEKWQNRQVVTSEIEAVREFGSAVLGTSASPDAADDARDYGSSGRIGMMHKPLGLFSNSARKAVVRDSNSLDFG